VSPLKYELGSYITEDGILHSHSRQRSFKIMMMRMFVTLDKAMPEIESIRGLNLAAVACTTVQVSRVPWWL
jgi:hypothetical protein